MYQMLEYLEGCGVRYAVVHTKCDVAGPPKRLAQVISLPQITHTAYALRVRCMYPVCAPRCTHHAARTTLHAPRCMHHAACVTLHASRYEPTHCAPVCR